MRTSIASRIRRAYFLLSLGLIAVMVFVVLMVSEGLEEAMLEQDLIRERRFFLDQIDRSRFRVWQTATLTAYFLPDQADPDAGQPPVFTGLPVGFTGEVAHRDNTHLVNIDRVDGGTFYIAKDITDFERRETIFEIILGFASFSVLAGGFLLAVWSSRRLIEPLRRLTSHIRSTPVGKHIPRVPSDYQDEELVAIAETFNHFLGEMENFIRREHSLVSLASHELQTPIAVISGALDVIEQRKQLSWDDSATLARIRKSVQDMEDNIQTLLRLARRAQSEEGVGSIDLRGMIGEVLEELDSHYRVGERVRLEILYDEPLNANPVLAKMLVRNLVKNACEHTAQNVWIRVMADRLEIIDEGPGLADDQINLLGKVVESPEQLAGMSGLGLYIATLVCERLGWELQVAESSRYGTRIHVVFRPENDAGNPRP